MNRRTLSFITTASLCLAMPAAAVTTTWNTDTVGDYDDGANWDNWIPTSTDEAIISSGQATRSGNLERAADTTVNGTGTLIVNGRLLNSRPNGDTTFTVADTGTLEVNGDYFIVQQTENFTSVFNQTGGTMTANINRGFYTSDGGNSSGSGTYNANGGVVNINMLSTSTTDNLHHVQIGRASDDAFNINGADVNFSSPNDNTRNVYLTRNSVLDMNSGSFDVDDFQFFIIGYGTNVGDGGQVVNGNAVASFDGGASFIDANLVMGDGQDGTLNITGGTLEIEGLMSTGGDVTPSNGSGVSTIDHSAGDFILSESVYLQDDSGGSTVWNMTGGNLTILGGGGISLGNSGSDLNVDFNFSGGVITLAGDQTGLLSESWFNAASGTFADYDSLNDLTTIAIPEPASLALLALGGLLAIRRHRA